MHSAFLEPLVVDNLLRLARALAKARGVSLNAVSRAAHGDSPAFAKLEGGEGSITVRKYDEAMIYLRDPANWPAGSKIPTPHEPWRKPKETIRG